ncbi:1265_t:CDS:2, partial [Funneliformis mosseae]
YKYLFSLPSSHSISLESAAAEFKFFIKQVASVTLNYRTYASQQESSSN